MPTIQFQDEHYDLLDGETVLDALLRQDIAIPHGCKSGICQGCLMQSKNYQPSVVEQKGLSSELKRLNYLLTCQCKPTKFIELNLPNSAESPQHEGRVINKTLLNEGVMRIRIKADVNYQPGQYITLLNDTLGTRSYSIASHPAYDNLLELHVKRMPQGRFSGWIFDKLQEGDKLIFRGPLGHCTYPTQEAGKKRQHPILMVAMGTGLAPILGVLKDALHQHHQQAIHLIVGTSHSDNFYYVDEIDALIKDHTQVTAHFVSQKGDAEYANQADIYEYCRNKFPDLKTHWVFVCGKESFVKKLKKQCFLQGANLSDIYADAFI